MKFHCLLFNLNGRIRQRTSGIHRIASHLRQQNWDVEVIDFASFWTLDQLQQLCKSRITTNTKWIGFSHIWQLDEEVAEKETIHQYIKTWPDHIETFCGWIKDTYPDLFIVTGTQQKPIFISKHIDYSVSGYGEYAIDALLQYKVSNGPRPKFEIIKGLGGQQLITSLHNYPAHPMREPIIKYEDRDFLQSGEWAQIEFSRGCKFACDFCNFPILGVKGDYTRTAESVRTQLMDSYDRFGISSYTVTDETFNDSTGKITKFADVVESLPFKPYFTGFIRADLMISRAADKEELLRMNFLGHYYGVESFNHTAVKFIGKGMHPDRVKKGLLDAKNYFNQHSDNMFIATLSLICGLPHETLESLVDTEEWLKDNWTDQNLISWAFEMTDNDLSEQSKISKDYIKYGYRKLPTFIPDELGMSIPHQHTSLVNWENDNMNFVQAVGIANQMQRHFLGKRPTCFTIAEIFLDEEMKCVSREDRLKKLSLWDIKKYHATTRAVDFVQNYITKKLNY
jgi:hypothetical protein